MSSTDATTGPARTHGRRAALLTLAAAGALAACGYTPVNAPGGAAAGLRQGAISVRAPATDDEYALVAALEQRLGTARRARYALDYTLAVEEAALGISPNQEAARFNVIGSIDWTVSDTATGAVATSDGFQSFTSYSATGTTIAGISAQEDAHRRLVQLMADQIVMRLSATAADWTR